MFELKKKKLRKMFFYSNEFMTKVNMGVIIDVYSLNESKTETTAISYEE